MKSPKTFGMILLACAVFTSAFAQMQVEKLNRGLISVRVGNNNYLSWRLFADDPFNVGFNIYRGTTLVNTAPITGATNYTDNGAAANSVYTVKAVVGGVEQAASEPSRNIANTQGSNAGYVQVGLQRPATGAQGGTYSPGDASVGDLDGDGEYEIVLKWDPNNQKDNSQDGTTDNVFIDAYKLDGTRLWRVDLGPNIRAGAHYTQFLVYDLDGDGKAEMMVKTAEGTKDGTGSLIKMGPAANANHNAVHRNSEGFVLAGQEYITVFDGQTGRELATAEYWPLRGTVNSWGDNYGNRVDRFNAAVAYLDGERPSAVFQRGYYTRMTFAAWDWRNGQLTRRWTFDSNTNSGGVDNRSYAGQGNHQLSVADADGDGKHDIITGTAAIGSNGKGMHFTGTGHGDALHVAHMIKGHPTPQIFMPHESNVEGVMLRQASNGTILFNHRKNTEKGIARGCAAELQAGYGFVFWGSENLGLYNVSGTVVGNIPASINHIIWWDGDLARELLDGDDKKKWVGIMKWSVANNRSTSLLEMTNTFHAINGTKSNPVLQADIFGDWREEVIFSNGTNAIRIYTTTMPTTHRLVTMMHDPTYRVAVSWQNSSYNQPPHPGYYIASDMDAGFPLNVAVIGGGVVTPPECTPGVDCAGDPCPEGQIGTRPNCTTPPPPDWMYRGSGEYIDSLLVFDLANAAAWSVNSNFDTGVKVYGDREYLATYANSGDRGREWIGTSMETRKLTTPATMAQFRMKKDGVVYILYENRANAVPQTWLAENGFNPPGGGSGEARTSVNDGQEERTFNLYWKAASAGDTIKLGANTADGTTNALMYLVAVGPDASSSVRAPSSQVMRNAMSVVRMGRGSFSVNYTIKDKSSVRLDLYDVKGVRVRTIVNAPKSAGAYREHFSAQGLAAGMYLVKLRVGGAVLQERVVVTR